MVRLLGASEAATRLGCRDSIGQSALHLDLKSLQVAMAGWVDGGERINAFRKVFRQLFMVQSIMCLNAAWSQSLDGLISGA